MTDLKRTELGGLLVELHREDGLIEAREGQTLVRLQRVGRKTRPFRPEIGTTRSRALRLTVDGAPADISVASFRLFWINKRVSVRYNNTRYTYRVVSDTLSQFKRGDVVIAGASGLYDQWQLSFADAKPGGPRDHRRRTGIVRGAGDGVRGRRVLAARVSVLVVALLSSLG